MAQTQREIRADCELGICRAVKYCPPDECYMRQLQRAAKSGPVTAMPGLEPGIPPSPRRLTLMVFEAPPDYQFDRDASVIDHIHLNQALASLRRSMQPSTRLTKKQKQDRWIGYSLCFWFTYAILMACAAMLLGDYPA
jgi:hypothetical protein